MARFYNDTTKVIVSVADEKAGRFTSGWTALADGEFEPARTSKPRGARQAKQDDDTEAAGESPASK